MDSLRLESFERDIAGVGTFILRCGQGPAVLLIHGSSPGACSSVNWKHNIEPLAQAGFTVYAYDQPGFGHSAVPQDLSMEFRVTHALALCRGLGFERFHLIGNSVGAYIAARVALADHRVDRLVLVASATLAPAASPEAAALARRHADELNAYEPSLERMREMTLKTLYRRELVTEDLVRERHEMSIGPRHEAMRRRRELPRPMPITDRLPEIANKTLILWGLNDRGAAVESAMMLLKALPDAELHIFSHCAHWVQWDRAEAFNRMVAGFLAGAA